MLIGNYQCISKIGEGKNSIVYSAFSNKTSESLVLKISNNENALENERLILSDLHHEGIIKLIEYFEEGSKKILVLESGRDLVEYINENGTFSENEAKYRFKIIFEAIQYLHERKIIHRDIKLENVIITEKRNLKLIDFDLCYNPKRKNLPNGCGTLPYLAPEIINCRSYDNKIDVWSLGITLYASVLGYFPFDSSDLYSYSYEALTKKPYFDFTKNLSNDFIDLIGRMLEKNPLKRISIKECLMHPWFSSLSL